MITKGTIWTSPAGETCEWLKDMKPTDPITADSMLLNGNPCVADQIIPNWLAHDLGGREFIIMMTPPDGVTVTHRVL